MLKRVRFIAYLATLVLAAGCAGGGSQQTVVPGIAQMNRALTSLVTTTCPPVKPPAVPAFFNGNCVSILLRQVPSGATVFAHNTNVNLIYEATGFIPVINEIQGRGFNPLWEVVDITFNTISPQQFTSESQIKDAANAGHITLMFTCNPPSTTCTVLSIPVVGSTGK